MAGELLSATIRDATPMDPQDGIGPSGSGWVATCVLAGITNIAGTLDGSKLTISVTDQGYTRTGAATTVNRTITGTVAVRRTHPNGNTLQISTNLTVLTIELALSDLIYADTTINSATIAAGFYTGSTASSALTITNNSTVAYKKPLGSWINFNGDTAEGNSYHVEFAAACYSAMDGQQVACAEFSVSDGVTTSASIFVGTPTLSTLQTIGNIPEVYAANIDMSGQTQGAISVVNAKIYPWIGDSSAVLDLAVDGTAWPTALPLTPLRVFCDRTGAYGGGYAYVDGVGAGTPAVSSTPATAKTTPYADFEAARAALKIWNNANRGHNDHGGSTVRFINDTGSLKTYNIATSSEDAHGTGRSIIEADPDANAEITLAATAFTQHAANTLWRGLTYTSAAGSSYAILGYDIANTTIYFDGMTFENPEAADFITWHAFKFLRNQTLRGANDFNLNNLASGNGAIVSMIGCVCDDIAAIPRFDNHPHALIGSDMPLYPMTFTQDAHGDDGCFIYNNNLRSLLLENTSDVTLSAGVANVQNVYEKDPADASAVCMNAFADGDRTTIINYLDIHNTGAGERCSRLYNDSVSNQVAPSGTQKFGRELYSIVDNYNIKGDRFSGGNGEGSTGNYAAEYGVSMSGYVSLFGQVSRGASEAPANNATDKYLGAYWPASNEYNLFMTALGYTQANIMDLFVNYTTQPQPSPARGGDYRLVGYPSALTDRVPSGKGVLKYDIDGTLRKQDGTGAAGAYEYPYTTPESSGTYWQSLNIGLTIGI